MHVSMWYIRTLVCGNTYSPEEVVGSSEVELQDVVSCLVGNWTPDPRAANTVEGWNFSPLHAQCSISARFSQGSGYWTPIVSLTAEKIFNHSLLLNLEATSFARSPPQQVLACMVILECTSYFLLKQFQDLKYLIHFEWFAEWQIWIYLKYFTGGYPFSQHHLWNRLLFPSVCFWHFC